jgi:hypothetical protein
MLSRRVYGKSQCNRLIKLVKGVGLVLGGIALFTLFSDALGFVMLSHPEIISILITGCMTVSICVVGITLCWRLNNKRALSRIGLVFSVLMFFFLAGVFVFGSGGFIFLPKSLQRKVGAATRLPLNTPSAIAIDSVGQIYVALPGFARVQVYSPNGHFIRSLFFDSAGAGVVMRIEKDRLYLLAFRGHGYHVMQLTGEILESSRRPPDGESLGSSEHLPLQTKDKKGHTYSIEDCGWSCKVTKAGPELTEKAILVEDPFLLWLLQGPLPLMPLVLLAWVISAVLGAMAGIAKPVQAVKGGNSHA